MTNAAAIPADESDTGLERTDQFGPHVQGKYIFKVSPITQNRPPATRSKPAT
jgi:hypothetical protein